MSQYNRKAWVVFTAKNDIWFLRFLKTGYKHCFILLQDGEHLISFDPLATHAEISIISNFSNEDALMSWLINQGHMVVSAKFFDATNKISPIAILNCVESIKRVLGIQKRFISTPYQLYKFLKKQENEHGKLI